jgi:hypothetical protein
MSYRLELHDTRGPGGHGAKSMAPRTRAYWAQSPRRANEGAIAAQLVPSHSGLDSRPTWQVRTGASQYPLFGIILYVSAEASFTEACKLPFSAAKPSRYLARPAYN